MVVKELPTVNELIDRGKYSSYYRWRAIQYIHAVIIWYKFVGRVPTVANDRFLLIGQV